MKGKLMRFRDRDAPITPEGLIFRTYGYDHPPDACFCDLEYASEKAYSTDDPKALRDGLPVRYYKFYLDGGLKFALAQDPPYKIRHRSLNRMMVGVTEKRISRVVRPDERLRELLSSEGDPLVEATREAINLVTDNSSLRIQDFGVFGSLAHGFHNIKYSDIDLIVYGVRQQSELRHALEALYCEGSMRNEFEDWTPQDPPHHWNFTNYSKEEYGEAQKRKLIFATYESKGLGREVNVEFEPVRRWEEVQNEYDRTERIVEEGRVQAVGEVLSDNEGGFMPSIYPVKLENVSAKVDPGDIRRVVSYVKEFRLQLKAGETATVIGNLERVVTKDDEFLQITLSYGRKYFDQLLRVAKDPS